MKLTSKGMLKSLMLCAGMFSLSAVAATDYVSDSFESGTDQLLVRQWEPGGVGTGAKWTSNGNPIQDLSKIVSGSVSGTYSNALPMAAERFGTVTDNLVLSLDTMGETLSRDAGSAAFFGEGSSTLYVDTMVKFVKSEEEPALPTAFKAAVYADVNTNLVIVSSFGRHTTSLKVDPDTWYRLTIELGTLTIESISFPVFRVRLNGEVVSVLFDSQQREWLPTNDTTENDSILQSVDFQGTGFIDQLVVTDVDPSTPTSVYLTLTGDVANVDVTPSSGNQVLDGSVISIVAHAGYILSDVVFTNGTVAEFRFGQSLTNFTAYAGFATNITISTMATNATVSTLFGGKDVNAGKVSTWLGLYPNATTASGDYNAYLLNVDPANYPTSTLKIDSVAVSGNTATITVSLGTLDLTTINGTLKVEKFATLGGSSVEETVSLQSDKTTVVNIDMTGYKFIKAWIK